MKVVSIQLALLLSFLATSLHAEELLILSNSEVKVGIDKEKGGSITWLSSNGYPKNIVNSIDPGRLIQQSYYAGNSLNRQSEGQHKAWSPWTWNPIQGGGVGSWARVSEFKKIENGSTLYSETIPKLWDMANEEADARMKQWTSFEPSMPNVIVVKCELICMRDENDQWGPAALRPQEIPACYFTRNFSMVKSYLGNKSWREEKQPPGPPWGKANPPRKTMAFFEKSGQGIAVFSPSSINNWNYGPHGHGSSDDPKAGPCMHVAPLDRVKLGHDSVYRYRYWLILGDEKSITNRADTLWKKYSKERAVLTTQDKK